MLTFYGDSLKVRQAENPVAQWSPSVPEGLKDSWRASGLQSMVFSQESRVPVLMQDGISHWCGGKAGWQKKKKKSTASPSDFVSRPPPEGATHSGEGPSSFS